MKTRNIQQCHLSKARDFRKCSFHLVSLVFAVFGHAMECHPKNERQRSTKKENWISSFLLAPLQGKTIFN